MAIRTVEEIEQQLEDFGFTIWGKLYQGSISKLQAVDKNGINVIVSLDESEEFELVYMIPFTIAKIVIEKCSPFSNKEHFQKQLRSMKRIVDKC